MRLLMTRLVSAALVILAGSSWACTSEEPGGAGEEVLVAAAANLSDAFGEMAKRFEAQTRIRVRLSFGATADLARQIEHGAPFDVFAAADVASVDALAKKGLLDDGPRAVYARGRLVLWLPRREETAVNRVEDLSGPGVVKVAVAKPDVAPYGRAAVEALQALSVWPRVEQKVVYAQNVMQAKQFAATGNADAAFLPRALVREGEGRLIEVSEGLHRPLEQAIGVVRGSKKRAAARRFVEFVLGEEGKAVLERFGYSVPANR